MVLLPRLLSEVPRELVLCWRVPTDWLPERLLSEDLVVLMRPVAELPERELLCGWVEVLLLEEAERLVAELLERLPLEAGVVRLVEELPERLLSELRVEVLLFEVLLERPVFVRSVAELPERLVLEERVEVLPLDDEVERLLSTALPRLLPLLPERPTG